PISVLGSANPVDGPSLADGRYVLTVFANAVSGANGGRLSGGGANGNFITTPDSFGGTGPKLYRDFGDASGDGTTDPTDLGQFRSTFNVNNTQAGYLQYLDADNSGVVDPQDLGQFRPRFNTNV